MRISSAMFECRSSSRSRNWKNGWLGTHRRGLLRRFRHGWVASDEPGLLPRCRSGATSLVWGFVTEQEIETCRAHRISRIAPKNGRCLCTVASGISTRNASQPRCPKRTKAFGGRNLPRIEFATRARASFSRIWATQLRRCGSARRATSLRLAKRLVDFLRYRRSSDAHGRIPDVKSALKPVFALQEGLGLG